MTDNRKLKPMPNIAFRLMDWIMSLQSAYPGHRRGDIHLIPLAKGMTVVDYACGPGYFTIPLAEAVRPEGRVYAVDIQPLAMETVRRKAERRGLKNITTVLVDSYNTALPAGIADIVVFLDTYHMVEDPEALLKEVHRLLKPDGRLFMDPGHMPTSPVLARVEKTGLFKLIKLEGNKMLLARR